MKKALLIILVIVFTVSMVAFGVGCKQQAAEITAAESMSEETTTAETMAEETTAAEAVEQKVCRLWFWGEDEAPGLTDFMQEVGDMYTEQIDPNVTWEITHVDIDQLYTGFYAAIEAKDAPELHLLWGGVLGLEPAWAGLLAPISDYVSEDTLSHIRPINRQEGYWNGQQWLVPLYLDPWPLAINRQVWTDSGLDPDNLPATYAEFVEAVIKIKDAGFTPWAVGIKDGYYGGWFPSILQYQFYNSPSDYHRAIAGMEDLGAAPHSDWWYLLEELYTVGAFNSDVNSLSLAEGQDLFLQGDVGMVMNVQPSISYYSREMGEDMIDVFIPPVDSTAFYAGKCPIPMQALSIPAVAKYKEEAGKFLEFFYTEEIQNMLYEKTSVFPGSDWLDGNLMKNPTDVKLYDWLNNNAAMTYVWQHPGALEEAAYAITQELLAGDIDADQAAQKYADAGEKWRTENPEAVKNFEIWANEDMPFMP